MAKVAGQSVRYGQVNVEYGMKLAGTPPEEDGPIWMVNLMHYRDTADYGDGRASTISGKEADDRYAPLGPLTYLFCLVVIMRVAIRQNQRFLGTTLILFVTMSTSISRWMFANITDGLLLLFTAGLVLLLMNNPDLRFSRAQFFLLLLMVVGSSLTRFSALIWISVALVFMIRKKFLYAGLTFITSVLGLLPIFLRPFSGHVLPGYSEKSLLEKMMIYPLNLVKVTVFEIGQLFVLDRILLVLILLTLIVSLTHLKRLSSQIFLALLVAVWLTGAINGVLGVNFRYQLPVVPVMIWALIDLLPEVKKLLNRNLSERFVESPHL